MFILLCSPHSFLLIELLTTSLILMSFFLSRIVTEKPHQGSVNKLLYCIVLHVVNFSKNGKRTDLHRSRKFTCYFSRKKSFMQHPQFLLHKRHLSEHLRKL